MREMGNQEDTGVKVLKKRSLLGRLGGLARMLLLFSFCHVNQAARIGKSSSNSLRSEFLQ